MKNKIKTKPAKACYNHIGGKLGELLLEMFVDQGWVQKNNPADKYYFITEKGEAEFSKIGLDLSQIA